MPFPVGLIVALILVGLALWVIGQLPGIDPAIMRIIRVVIIVCAVVYVLYWFIGVFPLLNGPGPEYRRVR